MRDRVLTLANDGAQLCHGAAAPAVGELLALFSSIVEHRAGTRLHGIPRLSALLAPTGAIGGIAATFLGKAYRAVRALHFDKTETSNWSLPWHQDRTIAVAERREVDGFGPWTVKAGIAHVEPPASLQAGMLTLRVHLDPVSEDNAPLLIAPGSHRLGRLPQEEIPDIVERCGIVTCCANAGDVWAYATPILHASAAARRPDHRRVLQIDYAAADLPSGLRWLGV